MADCSRTVNSDQTPSLPNSGPVNLASEQIEKHMIDRVYGLLTGKLMKPEQDYKKHYREWNSLYISKVWLLAVYKYSGGSCLSDVSLTLHSAEKQRLLFC